MRLTCYINSLYKIQKYSGKDYKFKICQTRYIKIKHKDKTGWIYSSLKKAYFSMSDKISYATRMEKESKKIQESCWMFSKSRLKKLSCSKTLLISYKNNVEL